MRPILVFGLVTVVWVLTALPLEREGASSTVYAQSVPACPQISIIDLGTLGGTFSSGVAINERGQVVGASETASGEIHAFLWHQGVMTDLGTLGGITSEVRAINERGQVVGSSETVSGNLHGFLWHQGVMTDLGTLGGTISQAFTINERGQVVGNSDTALGEGHAALWTKGCPQ